MMVSGINILKGIAGSGEQNWAEREELNCKASSIESPPPWHGAPEQESFITAILDGAELAGIQYPIQSVVDGELLREGEPRARGLFVAEADPEGAAHTSLEGDWKAYLRVYP